MADATRSHAPPPGATGALVLASGEVLWGHGFGAEGEALGEVCFNTAMTGYQEIMTDPSYAGQMVNFTFPHIGNCGANAEDDEAGAAHAVGLIVREHVTAPSNFRAQEGFEAWLVRHGRIGLAGIDTRALTRRVREGGAPNAVIAHDATGTFDMPAMLARARGWSGLEGLDLAKTVEAGDGYVWTQGVWHLGQGFADHPAGRRKRVVALDYGAKLTILRNLTAAGCDVMVMPGTSSFDEIMAHQPDGLFLSNGPGDPAATGAYAIPVIRQWLATGKPLFGICLGHQMLALALGARTTKMNQGHRGANHPVRRDADGRVEITSMNHGFAVEGGTLPEGVIQSHVSLFDGSNCGLEVAGKPVFSVQYHPEASPGPQDSRYLFARFADLMKAA